MLQRFKFTLILVVCFALIACKSSNQTNIDNNNNDNSNQNIVYPDPYEPCVVQKLPQYKYKDLKKNIKYPEYAKKHFIEGKVIVRALIDVNGDVLKTLIEDTDSKALNKAAQTAVMQTKFKPAIKDGKPIIAWVSIPVRFKLEQGTDQNTNYVDIFLEIIFHFLYNIR